MTTTAVAGERWVARPLPVARPALRLFCFPHAGTGVARFQPWANLLPADIELCLVRLPGRETRLREQPFTRLLPAVDAALDAIQPYLDRPFALFGHSMGALMAYELTRRLEARARALPHHVFLSGRRAPQLPEPEPPMRDLPDALFVDELARRYGEGSATLLRDAELRSVFLPVVRADMEAVETYEYAPGPPLDVPITAFGGVSDPRANQAELEGWREHTTSAFQLIRFPGDHFFLHAVRPQLIEAMLRSIR